MARLARLEYIAQTKQDRELHDKIATERKEARYRKHYNICQEVLCDIVDFAAKVGEYRELTDKWVIAKYCTYAILKNEKIKSIETYLEKSIKM